MFIVLINYCLSEETNMELSMTGGCLCGKVRYKISAPPIDNFNCHCRTCQRAVGAAYLSAMLVPVSAFTVTGVYKEFATIAASGHTLYRAFCPECGTMIFARNSHFTNICPVAATTLDDPSLFKPQKDIWVADAQPWDIMNPDLPKYAGSPW
jgi:hypothetical protein